MKFSAEARALGQKLLEHHRARCSGMSIQPYDLTDSQVSRISIRYGALCQRAGMPFLTPSSGGFLREIAVWCEQEGWPPINALAVNESGLPGEGTTALRAVAMPNGPGKSVRQLPFLPIRKRCPIKFAAVLRANV